MEVVLLGMLIYILIFLVFLLFILLLTKRKSKYQYNQEKGDKILEKINSFEFDGQKINYLKKIDPFVFEEIILTAFKNKGFKIKRNKKYTGDGGIDGIVFYNNQKYLVQAKRYKNHINNQHVEEFSNLCLENKCKGYFVHTGKTGKKSNHIQQHSGHIKIISGSKLLNLFDPKVQG